MYRAEHLNRSQETCKRAPGATQSVSSGSAAFGVPRWRLQWATLVSRPSGSAISVVAVSPIPSPLVRVPTRRPYSTCRHTLCLHAGTHARTLVVFSESLWLTNNLVQLPPCASSHVLIDEGRRGAQHMCEVAVVDAQVLKESGYGFGH